jgi:broad specificity phosphatase PhoE
MHEDLMSEWLDPSKSLAEVNREAVEKLPEYIAACIPTEHGEYMARAFEPFREVHRRLETAVETLPDEEAAVLVIQAHTAMVKTFAALFAFTTLR